MKIRQILSLILILLLGSGCLIIPLPAVSQSMYAFKDKLRELTVGSTTREEVISRIGEPDIKLKRFILYKNRVQSGGARIAYWAGIPIPPNEVISLAQGSKRIQGDWMDAAFEFDEHGILTEYRFIELEYDTPYPDAAECFSDAKSNYYSCLSLTEEKNTRLSQCEETLENSLESCHLIENLNIEKDCDPGMESCY